MNSAGQAASMGSSRQVMFQIGSATQNAGFTPQVGQHLPREWTYNVSDRGPSSDSYQTLIDLKHRLPISLPRCCLTSWVHPALCSFFCSRFQLLQSLVFLPCLLLCQSLLLNLQKKSQFWDLFFNLYLSAQGLGNRSSDFRNERPWLKPSIIDSTIVRASYVSSNLVKSPVTWFC